MNPEVKAASDKWNEALVKFLDSTHNQPKGTFLNDACGIIALTTEAVFGALGTPFTLILLSAIQRAKQACGDKLSENLQRLGQEWNEVQQAFLDMQAIAETHGNKGDTAVCKLLKEAHEAAICVIGNEEALKAFGSGMYLVYKMSGGIGGGPSSEEQVAPSREEVEQGILNEDCDSCPNAGSCETEGQMRQAKAEILSRESSGGNGHLVVPAPEKEYIH